MPTIGQQPVENEEDVDVAALPPPFGEDGHALKEDAVSVALVAPVEPMVAEDGSVEEESAQDVDAKSIGATVAIANATALGLGLGSAEEAAAVAAAETSNDDEKPAALDPDPKIALRMASQMKDKSQRDRALVRVLKDARREMEEAKAVDMGTTYRLGAAKEAYDLCAQLLAGYTPLNARLALKKKKVLANGSRKSDVDHVAKRMKTEPVGVEHESAEHSLQQHPLVLEGIAEAEAPTETPAENINMASYPSTPRIKGQVQPEGENIILPTNDIYLPEYFTSGGGMSEEIIANFRNSFYLHLTKGAADSTNIDDWRPPPNNANLKSCAQIAEWIHIATHWNTGADGLDAGAFRAKHKTWYSRMKPVTYNLGRRTGIHLRRLGESSSGGGYGPEGTTVLCRYNKAGNKSTVYLDMSRLFDALFQIHALELAHRGRDATKNLADERYANIPDATVRAFLDTCPVCSARRGRGPLVAEGTAHHYHHQEM